MKKYIAVVLAALLAVSLSACSNDSVGDSSTGRQEDNAQHENADNYGDNDLADLAKKLVSDSNNRYENISETEDELLTFESDTAAMNMIVKEAVNTYRADIKTTKYNGKTAAEATVHDVCVENNIDDSNDFYTRKINGVKYSMVYTVNKNSVGSVNLSGGDTLFDGNALTGSETIVSLSDTEPNESEKKVNALDVMYSDTATMNMLIKEAVNTYRADITTTTYNGKTAAEATVHDVCAENDIKDSNKYYIRNIDGIKYIMVYTVNTDNEGEVKLSGGDNIFKGIELTGSETIASLSDTKSTDDAEKKYDVGAMQSDTVMVNMLVKEAINVYRADITTTTYNGKTAAKATVHDVCVENNIDDSDDFYTREIDGVEYSMVYTVNENNVFSVELSDGDTVYEGNALTGSETIVSLSDTKSTDDTEKKYDVSVMKSDTATMNMLVKEAVYTHRAGITITKWNGKTSAEATVHDICVENNIDDSDDFYTREIDGVKYSMVFNVYHDNKEAKCSVELSGGDTVYDGLTLTGSETIVSLSDRKNND